VFGIELQDQFSVRSGYLRHYIDALLLNDRLQKLTGAQHESVAMPLPRAQFTLDRMPLLKRADIFLFGGAILGESGHLR
jgi:hypothetical protein